MTKKLNGNLHTDLEIGFSKDNKFVICEPNKKTSSKTNIWSKKESKITSVLQNTLADSLLINHKQHTSRKEEMVQ